MKFQCTLKNALLIIRDRFGMSFATKGLGYLGALYLPLPLLARYKLSCYQTTCYRLFQCFAENTLLKTTCHFLLLLVGFDTLTYRKDYDRSLYLWVISRQDGRAEVIAEPTAASPPEPLAGEDHFC